MGSDQVHFQPPANVLLKYPAIVYNLDYGVTEFAGNLPYTFSKRYQVTAIDRDPDSELSDKLAGLPMCTMNRTYRSDGLNHFVFNIYF